MIRREDLAAIADRTLFAPELSQAESRPVKISGLGTLTATVVPTTGPAPWNLPGPRKTSYRLTLTAKVAKAEAPADWTGGARLVSAALQDDIRHLAVALGAPVEVRAIDRRFGSEASRLAVKVAP